MVFFEVSRDKFSSSHNTLRMKQGGNVLNDF